MKVSILICVHPIFQIVRLNDAYAKMGMILETVRQRLSYLPQKAAILKIRTER